MSDPVTIVELIVPSRDNIELFSNVQRGTIFVWFFSAFVITVVTGIRLISGQYDESHAKYGENDPQSVPAQSFENFQHEVLKSQITNEDDPGTVKLGKKIEKLNTMLLPVILVFLLNFVVGTTYAFSFVLYFLILIPVVLFNLAELHKRLFNHKAFVCFFENIWLVGCFFWLLNIWVTGKYQQPYYMVTRILP